MEAFTIQESDELVKMLKNSATFDLAVGILGDKKIIPWSYIRIVRKLLQDRPGEDVIRARKTQSKRGHQNARRAYGKLKVK